MDSAVQKVEWYLNMPWSYDSVYHSNCHRCPQLIVTTQNWKLGNNLFLYLPQCRAPESLTAETHIEVASPQDPQCTAEGCLTQQGLSPIHPEEEIASVTSFLTCHS